MATFLREHEHIIGRQDEVELDCSRTCPMHVACLSFLLQQFLARVHLAARHHGSLASFVRTASSGPSCRYTEGLRRSLTEAQDFFAILSRAFQGRSYRCSSSTNTQIRVRGKIHGRAIWYISPRKVRKTGR